MGTVNSLQELFDLCAGIVKDANGCKEWPFGYFAKGKGYPYVRYEKQNRRVNRLLLEYKLGRKIRPGFFSLHTCDNKRCVNLEHYYEGTHQNNMDDAKARNRMVSGDNHPARINPERMSHAEKHYARIDPSRVPHGSKQYKAKVNEDDVREMRRLHQSELMTEAELSRKYGLHQSTTWGILNRKSWKHVT
jgi:hypothetical protein